MNDEESMDSRVSAKSLDSTIRLCVLDMGQSYASPFPWLVRYLRHNHDVLSVEIIYIDDKLWEFVIKCTRTE